MGKPSGGEREVNLGSNVVKRLTRNIRGINHHVYFVNYFNGVGLVSDLLQDDIYDCGTVKNNAKGLPKQMRVTCGSKTPKSCSQGKAEFGKKVE